MYIIKLIIQNIILFVPGRYYKIDYPEHNIVRARTQIALIKAMDAQWDEIQRFVSEL